MPSKIYTAPGLTNAPALRYELLADASIPLAGVIVETVSTIEGTSTVTVFADVDPTPADAEIQSVIDAHDPSADWSPPAEDQPRSDVATPSFPYLGRFAQVGDLPSPTLERAIAVVESTTSATGSDLYVRRGGVWQQIGPSTSVALAAAIGTAQCGGDPAQNVSPYPSITGFVWDFIYLRSEAVGAPWGRYAYAGRLENAGDRIDWPIWAAQPDGGELGIVFLPADTSPAPANASSITAAWGGQWVGGCSFVLQGANWKMRGSGSQGSGFGNGPDISAGEQLSALVLSGGNIEIREAGSAKSSSFTVPAGGLDVWVTTQTVEQRWPPAFASNAPLPTPGTPDAADTAIYIPTHALALDGNNDLVIVPNGAGIGNVLRWDQDWTISVRLPSNDDVDTDYYQTLFSRGLWNGIGLNRNTAGLTLHAFNELGLRSAPADFDPDLSGAVLFFAYDASESELCLHVGDELLAKLTVPSSVALSSTTSAGFGIGALTYYTGSYYGWAGMLHEVFLLDRKMTATEREDVVRDPQLANHSWYGDVISWWPLGTDDVYPTMRNLVAGADDGELVNASAETIVEI